MKYRKKPVVIEAVQWTGKNLNDLLLWAKRDIGVDLSTDQLKIKTLEGVMTADLGDWIIRGVKGEYYPCKPDIFEATYEDADRRAPDPLPGLLREAREALEAAAKGGEAAADELMTEFISKKRAANWGIINGGLLACGTALRILPRLDAALAPQAGEGRGPKEGWAHIREADLAALLTELDKLRAAPHP